MSRIFDYKMGPEQFATPAIPQNETAEKVVLSILMQNYSVFDSVRWDEDMFFNPAHQIIFRAIRACKNNRRPADFFSVQAMIEENGFLEKVGGPAALIDLHTAYPSPTVDAAKFFRVDLIKARKFRRALKAMTGQERELANMTGDISGLAKDLTSLEEEDEEEHKRPTLKQNIITLINRLEQKEPPERFDTGIFGLDAILKGGFSRKEVAVIAAETSGGKSILLLQAALEAAKAGKHVAVFSLEMSGDQVIQRMAACFGRCQIIPFHELIEEKRSGEIGAMQAALMGIADLNITIRDDFSSIEDIESECRNMKSDGPLDVVVVDYIQLASTQTKSRSENREQQVSEVCRRMKLMSNALDVCVLTASQLNDDGLLRESRAIGMHADYVISIQHNSGESSVKVVKNRNGERDRSTKIRMIGAQSRFEWEPV